MGELEIRHVKLRAAPADLAAVEAFYDDELCLPRWLEFAAGERRPFYHFALLAPGDRFSAARAWIEQRAELLDTPGAGGPVMDFPAWDAKAVYFHDPAGNIVELIAHDVREGSAEPFSASELVGVSEVGLVAADPAATVAALGRDHGLELWSGTVEEGLAFVGERAHTLLVVPEGRGWLPTWRPAEAHPVEVDLVLGDSSVRVVLP